MKYSGDITSNVASGAKMKFLSFNLFYLLVMWTVITRIISFHLFQVGSFQTEINLFLGPTLFYQWSMNHLLVLCYISNTPLRTIFSCHLAL